MFQGGVVLKMATKKTAEGFRPLLFQGGVVRFSPVFAQGVVLDPSCFRGV